MMMYKKIDMVDFGLNSYKRVLGFMLSEVEKGNECLISWEVVGGVKRIRLYVK